MTSASASTSTSATPAAPAPATAPAAGPSPLPERGEGSLPEVYASVAIPRTPGFLRRLFAFAGPAYMVSVGYMDPGNWATDIEGGSRFAYQLVWVLLMSNLMAVLLQTLSARLGIVTGRDLAQACRDYYGRPIGFALWVLCEVAIAATDLAEVLGTAIGLNLLFGIDVMTGVVLTVLDVFLLLAMQRLGIRKMEGFILALVATIGACYVLEIFLAKPDWGGVVSGFTPYFESEAALYVAIGILGATVMPHNLYLHSALVQTRMVDRTPEGKRQANRYNLVDSVVALNCAFFVNAAILVLSAATFHRNGHVVTEIKEAHTLLAPLLGTSLASLAFALALLCAGQSSTLTGTLAGQVVMEGFLHFRMRPWLRRLVTRSIALIPAVIVIAMFGDAGTYKLLILSQVILSLQLPFAVIPLIQLTGDRALMGEFASGKTVKVLAWLSAAIIVGLNVKLVVGTISGWIEESAHPTLTALGIIPFAAAVGFLLLVVVFRPLLRARPAAVAAPPEEPTLAELLGEAQPAYRRIAVALAADPADRAALAHAISLARRYDAEAVLIHVAEGFGPRFYGGESTDQETVDDTRYLERIRAEAAKVGVKARVKLLYGDPAVELAKAVEEEKFDLLVMGAHAHGFFGDLLFGSTVDPVRHGVHMPVLVVRGDGGG